MLKRIAVNMARHTWSIYSFWNLIDFSSTKKVITLFIFRPSWLLESNMKEVMKEPGWIKICQELQGSQSHRIHKHTVITDIDLQTQSIHENIFCLKLTYFYIFYLCIWVSIAGLLNVGRCDRFLKIEAWVTILTRGFDKSNQCGICPFVTM